jgi:hypothetical protein
VLSSGVAARGKDVPGTGFQVARLAEIAKFAINTVFGNLFEEASNHKVRWPPGHGHCK